MKEYDCPNCEQKMKLVSDEATNHRRFECENPDCVINRIDLWAKSKFFTGFLEPKKQFFQVSLDKKPFAIWKMTEPDMIEFITWLNAFEKKSLITDPTKPDKVFTYQITEDPMPNPDEIVW